MSSIRAESATPPTAINLSHQLRQAHAQIAALAEKNEQLVKTLRSVRKDVEKLEAKPEAGLPLTVALITGLCKQNRQIEVLCAGRRMRVSVHSQVDDTELAVGKLALVSEQMVVVEVLAPARTGEAVTIDEVLNPQHVLVTTGGGGTRVLELAAQICAQELQPGDTLTANLRANIATAVVERTSVAQLIVSETPDVSWDDIGGLGAQIEEIRDALELPFQHPELYREYGLRAPKGMLLYGPPGCGKTLIAKAVAAALSCTADNLHTAKKAAFFNIKGPELLSKFVGETERQIRAIFEQARKVAAEDRPVVIFFDEMEALFRTRGTGVSSDVETMIVPQVLAEIDGVETLRNVLIIGASNREDMIDPAILRPGRLDLKIRINRPDYSGALEILEKHLHAQLPLDPVQLKVFSEDRESAVAAMRADVAKALYDRSAHNAIYEVTYTSGSKETLYLGDLISGAMLAAIVARAKTIAIKDELAGGSGGISTTRLLAAAEAEVRHSEEITRAANPEGWLRVIGYRGQMVRNIRMLSFFGRNNFSVNGDKL